jgi:hypothetical protein
MENMSTVKLIKCSILVNVHKLLLERNLDFKPPVKDCLPSYLLTAWRTEDLKDRLITLWETGIQMQE